MGFVQLLNKFYPVEDLPAWVITIYKYVSRGITSYAVRRTKRPSWLKSILTKSSGEYSYTVITPIYNSEKYLDTYFYSLTRQSLDFKKHITLILIDDGSTDSSAKIITKWKKRYPQNIVYIYQEHSGQGKARNIGLTHAATPWITFIDSDDFVERDYFKKIDNCIRIYGFDQIKLICCYQLMYYEYKNEIKDIYPFRFFFEDDVILCPKNDLLNYFFISVSSAFFSLQEIQRQNIKFIDNKEVVSFEDGHFMLRYISNIESGYNILYRCPKYYFTKRKDKSAIANKLPASKEYYGAVLEQAVLPILKHYQSISGGVPKFVQLAVLYYMSFFIIHLSASNKKINFLSSQEKHVLRQTIFEIFSYIDNNAILSISPRISGLTWFHKLGIIQCLKSSQTKSKYVYIDRYDIRKQQMRLRSFHFNSYFELKIFADGNYVEHSFSKLTKHTFLGELFLYEFFIWVPIKFKRCLEVFLNGSRLTIDINGRKVDCLRYTDLFQNIANTLKRQQMPPIHASWIFIDRDTQADDNAEHLYRYIMRTYPKQRIFFALRKNSHDWDRLEKEGFSLIDFGTKEFFQVLKGASVILSSHYIFNIMKNHRALLKGKLFVFLQHGITIHDISFSANKMDIDLFVCSSWGEYNSIIKEGSPYSLCAKETKLTGFPRHDNLLRLNSKYDSSNRTILIMPTWRNHFAGKVKQGSFEREIVYSFYESEYCIAWTNILKSEKFFALRNKYGFQALFFPHFATQEYFKNIDFGSSITTIFHSSGSIQKFFVEATFLLTDYSSVAFEMAFLRKPTIYYQFDVDVFYNGIHYEKSYFDFVEHGFGDVVTNEEDLLLSLEILMRHDGKASRKYLDRMEKTFAYSDNNNSERVYRAVLEMGNAD